MSYRLCLRLFCLLVLIFSLGACRRVEVPPSSEGQVKFDFEGTIANAPLKLEAGKAGYFQFTGYTQVVGQPTAFWGQLMRTDSTPAEGMLRITFYDSQLRSSIIADIASVLPPGNYAFERGGLAPIKGFVFKADTLAQTGQFIWDFGDGTSATGALVTKTYNQLGPYPVTLSVVSTTCTDSLSNRIVYAPSGFANCDATFTLPTNNGAGTYSFVAPQGYDTYEWMIDALRITSQRADSVALADGLHHVCLTVNGPGCPNANYCRNFYVGTNQGTCVADFSANKTNVTPLPFSRVRIDYTAPNGRRYSSKSSTGQPFGRYCRLISIREYLRNASSQRTAEIEVETNCRLFEVGNEGNTLDIASTRWVTAVAYP